MHCTCRDSRPAGNQGKYGVCRKSRNTYSHTHSLTFSNTHTEVLSSPLHVWWKVRFALCSRTAHKNLRDLSSPSNLPSIYPCCQRSSLMQRYPGNPKRCECNGHKNDGGAGECNGVHPVECGHWCYVDDDAQCINTFPSSNSPYRWTCEACAGEHRKPGVYAN